MDSPWLSVGRASVHGVRTADHLQHALRRFVDLVRDAEGRLNELNVFPVADSDTGTNVLRTAEAITAGFRESIDDAGKDAAVDLDELARSIGRSALMSSRGNSGLILGQYLTGFSLALVEDPWPEEWASALLAGANLARTAVAEPVEGTILTVADAVAQATGESVPEILLDATRRADAAVVQTQFQLPVLTERGLVDAGGVALALFVRALTDVVSNEPEFTIADRLGSGPTRRKGDAAPVTAPVIVGYELQFNCRLNNPAANTPGYAADTAQRVRDLLVSLGTDVVVGEDQEILAAHVHALDIGRVIEAVMYLEPFNIRIEALLETHPSWGKRG